MQQLNESSVFRISIIVSNPNHPIDQKRTERKMKILRIKAGDRGTALSTARSRLSKAGFKIHQINLVGIVNEENNDSDGDTSNYSGWWDPARKALYDKHKAKSRTPEEAKKERQKNAEALKAVSDLAAQLRKRKEER